MGKQPHNTSLLSKLLDKYQRKNDLKALEIIKGISPNAWQHINLYGTYGFGKIPNIKDLFKILENVDIEQIILNLDQE